MTVPIFLALALVGGLGAGTRFTVDTLIGRLFAGTLPWGTLAINLTGSFALGLVTGVLGHHLVAPGWQPVIGIGFLGGYTTFSTASLETVRLLQDGRRRAAVVVGLGGLLASVAAAGLGLWWGGLL
ncbi:fluoride efflux transporter CrcB [Aestuariimicrobium soli]|uniref:fluoride efflux transporter CrcB n=1 Tax=Aestuariimicrobium soli TaxID=2035834 RepID=UPI003EBD8E3C